MHETQLYINQSVSQSVNQLVKTIMVLYTVRFCF